MNDQVANTQALEVQIDQARDAVKLKDALVNLQSNADFNLVVNTGYFENQAIMLVDGLADVALQDPIQQAALNHSLRAIGELKSYFRKVVQIGKTMEKTIMEAQAELDNLGE